MINTHSLKQAFFIEKAGFSIEFIGFPKELKAAQMNGFFSMIVSSISFL